LQEHDLENRSIDDLTPAASSFSAIFALSVFIHKYRK